MAQPDMAADLAQAAEELGFTSLWMPEHVVIPLGLESTYPYSPDGKLPAEGMTADAPDPLLWLAFVAGRTTRIRLCTGVLVLAQRNPLVVAKQAATLDVLSKGRAVLGIGAGWLAEEFAALNVPFAERGRRTDEYVAVMRALWAAEPASFHGEFTDFDHCVSLPNPVQTNGIPIVVGGDTARAARRAGELGNGWFPGTPNPATLAPLVEVMRSAATAVGRDPEAISLQTSYSGKPATLEALQALGFSHFTLGVPGDRIVGPGALDATLGGLAARVGLR
ncbi:MAG: putative F420-dependent oxidoreductase, Rv2161c family [Acidimicrobiia bacterium]|nr:putative F420-dependent oxidoreductase, Rv2161c family [Acidimicrobiia bacterium]